ncbi:hypothetical protein AX17_002149 [Amanita inopinata Kibby_2008]|nr:hypothetical protein AX17_002149 [Amanita inopinata Kibby_2008]
MSRLDTQDFDYSAGLSLLRQRSGGGREHVNGYSPNLGLSSYTPQLDRRSSMGLPGFPLASAHFSRSLSTREREYAFGMGDNLSLGPNRHNPSNASTTQTSISSLNHNSASLHPSPPLHQLNTLYNSPPNSDRDAQALRSAPQTTSTNTPSTLSSRSTIWWGDLELWMDEEYARQVCNLMGWDPTNIRVPRPPPDPITGQQANNPGYCFLTFPTPAHAASVLAQINNSGGSNPPVMPNSSKQFFMNWASNVPSASPISYPVLPSVAPNSTPAQQFQKEYSIFVGDLAPETSNSDLVAVFRNPVLGLRNDREPKFIRPFLSCKSAKIMLDPVTGVSRGYGFVRFTDESDQQRALIEMHGLYCLSRPMRISPATAKYKPPPALPAPDLPQVQYPVSNAVTLALPLHATAQAKSVSAPIAATTSNSSLNGNAVSTSSSGSTLGGSSSGSSLSSGTVSNGSVSAPLNSLTSEEMMKLPTNVLAQIAQQYANSDMKVTKPASGVSVTSPYAQDITKQNEENGQRYSIPEESWKHHAQARAILGNLIGPNGEQLTSTDPYNTTVFVGGLSPLISEETLKTFFAPFGDIHYVKVPAGKHCGFVQFVRKADAERAIEKMQGFPVGGSRIRLSWGRSQYKAAQAAAQAAQAAALQAQYQATIAQQGAMSQEQALQLLQKFTLQGYLDNPLPLNIQQNGASINNSTTVTNGGYPGSTPSNAFHDFQSRAALLGLKGEGQQSLEAYLTNGYIPQTNDSQRIQTNFSPFSPDPNIYESDTRRRDATAYPLPHPSKAYAPGFYPLSMQAGDMKSAANDVNGDNSTKPSSTEASRYVDFLEPSSAMYSSRRSDPANSRSSSGSASRAGPEGGHDSDPLQDLNGTLASLDLDREKLWKSPADSFDRNGSLSQTPLRKDETNSP